jgi:hypothetical protein
MAIIESRVKNGTLTLGTLPGTDFSCQVTNIRVGTAYTDDGDPLEVLCGDTIPAGRKLDQRTLAGTVVQDFTSPTGLTEYVYDNELQTVDFTYVPNPDDGSPTLSGQVRIEVPAETYGGDVNSRLTSDFEFPIVGDLVRTPPVGALEAGAGEDQAELEAAAAES